DDRFLSSALPTCRQATENDGLRHFAVTHYCWWEIVRQSGSLQRSHQRDGAVGHTTAVVREIIRQLVGKRVSAPRLGHITYLRRGAGGAFLAVIPWHATHAPASGSLGMDMYRP